MSATQPGTGRGVLVVVVAYGGLAELPECIERILQSNHVRPLLVVVDNGGAHAELARLEDQRRVVVVRPGRNLGFAAGVNAALATVGEGIADETIVVLVNQDCFVDADAIDALAERLDSDERIGVVGARIFDRDRRTLQHAGGVIHANGLTEHRGRGSTCEDSHRDAADVAYVTGALCAFRMGTWRRIGPFDAAYQPVYFEEVDFCVRVRAAGLRVVYEPRAVAIHAEATSSGGVDSPRFLERYHRNRIRFLVRHRLAGRHALAVLAAEIAWLARQRRLGQILPALRAWAALPLEMRRARRSPRRR